MSLNIFSTIWHLPMVWDFIIPLSIILLFCIYLFWEGEYGTSVKKRYSLRFRPK